MESYTREQFNKEQARKEHKENIKTKEADCLCNLIITNDVLVVGLVVRTTTSRKIVEMRTIW